MYSHSVSLHPGVYACMGTHELIAGMSVILRWTGIPTHRSSNKQLLDEVFVISRIIEDEVGVIS